MWGGLGLSLTSHICGSDHVTMVCQVSPCLKVGMLTTSERLGLSQPVPGWGCTFLGGPWMGGTRQEQDVS